MLIGSPEVPPASSQGSSPRPPRWSKVREEEHGSHADQSCDLFNRCTAVYWTIAVLWLLGTMRIQYEYKHHNFNTLWLWHSQFAMVFRWLWSIKDLSWSIHNHRASTIIYCYSYSAIISNPESRSPPPAVACSSGIQPSITHHPTRPMIQEFIVQGSRRRRIARNPPKSIMDMKIS